jgi:hypothetical protein
VCARQPVMFVLPTIWHAQYCSLSLSLFLSHTHNTTRVSEWVYGVNSIPDSASKAKQSKQLTFFFWVSNLSFFLSHVCTPLSVKSAFFSFLLFLSQHNTPSHSHLTSPHLYKLLFSASLITTKTLSLLFISFQLQYA